MPPSHCRKAHILALIKKFVLSKDYFYYTSQLHHNAPAMRKLVLIVVAIFINATMALGPSGIPVPTQNITGWRLLVTDDFLTDLPYPKWYRYGGNSGQGGWHPSHAVVDTDKNILRLRTYQDDQCCGGSWTWGGVSMIQSEFNQVYGKYEVRMRMDRGRGVAGVALLWPGDNSWPPEIDFYEDAGGPFTNNGVRNRTSATTHWDKTNQQATLFIDADFFDWKTIGVEWTPDMIHYTLDSQVWGNYTGVGIPTIPMGLGIQTQTGNGDCESWFGCIDASTPAEVTMEIDWIAVWAYDTTVVAPETPLPDQSSTPSSISPLSGSTPVTSTAPKSGQNTPGALIRASSAWSLSLGALIVLPFMV